MARNNSGSVIAGYATGIVRGQEYVGGLVGNNDDGSISNSRYAQLATGSLIPAPQHEELAAAGILPIGQPFLMAPVPVGLQVTLLPPQPLGPEAQSHPARRYVDLQSGQPGLQSSPPPPLLVHRPPLALLPAIHDLMPGPGYVGPQAVPPQFLSPVFPIRPDVPATPGAAAAVTPPRTRRTCYNPSHRRDNPTGGPMS